MQVDELKDKIDEASSPAERQAREEQDREIQNYKVLRHEWWLVWVTFVVSLVMGAWNILLFMTTVPGFMGALTAFMAICLEGTAFWSVMNYSRTIGTHKRVMAGTAIVLGGFSIVHAVFSMIHYTGYAQGWWFVEFYSNVIAMPLIVVLVSVAAAVLVMTHPLAAMRAKLALNKINGMIGRAAVLAEKDRKLAGAEVMALNAKVTQLENMIYAALVPLMEDQGRLKMQIEGIISGIGDHDIRNEVRQAFEELKAPLQLPASRNGAGNPGAGGTGLITTRNP